MLNCKQITELASKRLENEVSGWQKLAMSMHLLICHNCRLYFKQLRFLQKAMGMAEHLSTGPSLSAEARQRIAEKIKVLRQSSKSDE